MSHAPTTAVLALEVWRASGRRTLERLRELVRLYAATRPGDNLDYCISAAIERVRPWEIETED